VVGWQLRSVSRSPYPTLRGVEAVAVSVPLLVLTFAAAYLGAGFADPAGFTERLSRIDAVYFAVTVFTTVGFGDIAPRSETARLLVTLQMVVDLVMVGLIAKVLVGAVRQRRNALGRSQP
jgi:voltage-gated potassium channel